MQVWANKNGSDLSRRWQAHAEYCEVEGSQVHTGTIDFQQDVHCPSPHCLRAPGDLALTNIRRCRTSSNSVRSMVIILTTAVVSIFTKGVSSCKESILLDILHSKLCFRNDRGPSSYDDHNARISDCTRPVTNTKLACADVRPMSVSADPSLATPEASNCHLVHE